MSDGCTGVALARIFLARICTIIMRIVLIASKAAFATKVGFGLRFQRVAATQASNFSAGVW